MAKDKKIIAVMGATGAQGGGLVRAILDDPDSGYSVRAITRHITSDRAKELAQLGAEVVEADEDDPASIREAFEGAYGAYCVTFFWEHMSPEKEKEQARTLAEAAKEANLQHVIWSTLEDTRDYIPLSDDRMPTLMHDYKVPHFDAKGESNAFFLNLNLPVTFLKTSFYWENFIYFGMGPQKGPDGKLAITLPMGNEELPSIAAEDIGKCAFGIFKGGEKYIGKSVGIASEHLTGAQMAHELEEVLGEEVVYNAVEPEDYRNFGFQGADDLGNMFQFNRDFAKVFNEERDTAVTKSLNPKLQSLHDWLIKNKDRIPID